MLLPEAFCEPVIVEERDNLFSTLTALLAAMIDTTAATIAMLSATMLNVFMGSRRLGFSFGEFGVEYHRCLGQRARLPKIFAGPASAPLNRSQVLDLPIHNNRLILPGVRNSCHFVAGTSCVSRRMAFALMAKMP
jgi:hypothetical protein